MTAPKNNEQENKPQMSTIPLDLLRDFLEPAYREGLIKYSRESWREGFLATVMVDSLLRHITQWFFDLEEYDPDAAKLGVKKHHLGGALFCLICLCDMVKNHPELDNRKKGKEEIIEFQSSINPSFSFNSEDLTKAIKKVSNAANNVLGDQK
jgi:hypothetical protein